MNFCVVCLWVYHTEIGAYKTSEINPVHGFTTSGCNTWILSSTNFINEICHFCKTTQGQKNKLTELML